MVMERGSLKIAARISGLRYPQSAPRERPLEKRDTLAEQMGTLRKWWITLVTAAATAAVLLGVGIALVGTGEDHSAVAASDTLPPLGSIPPRAGAAATPQAAGVGPEGVPLTDGKRLGPPSAPKPGQARGGIPCGTTEQLTYHVHAYLAIFVNGKPRAVPLGVGIGGPRKITKSAQGSFVSGGSCFAFLHTHSSDGIIHIEAPGPVKFTLGQFFDVWAQALGRTHLGPVNGRVIAYVNGKRWKGDPRAIPLARHKQIQLEVGRPQVTPKQIEFPAGI
jgi:hypothetical protein